MKTFTVFIAQGTDDVRVSADNWETADRMLILYCVGQDGKRETAAIFQHWGHFVVSEIQP